MSHSVRSLESETVAAQAEEAGIPISRRLNTSDELVPGMIATVLVTGGAVLMLQHRDSSPGCFADVERRTVTAEYIHG